VSGELPARNFVLVRANKGMTTTKSQVNKLRRLKNSRPAFATIVENPGITPIRARTLGWTSPAHIGKAPKQVRVIITRSQTFKGSKISVDSWVLFLFENTSLYDLPLFVVGKQPTVDW
jgi:hypothetical protein